MADEDMETPGGEGKRLRRVACTCPNCKESGGRWAWQKNTHYRHTHTRRCRCWTHLFLKSFLMSKELRKTKWCPKSLLTIIITREEIRNYIYSFSATTNFNTTIKSVTVRSIYVFYSFFRRLTEVRAWGRRSSISATSPAAGRFTGRHLISELTCAGTVERDLSSATGCSAGRGSPGATSCKDTGGHTQVRQRSNQPRHLLTQLNCLFPLCFYCVNIYKSS